MKRTPLRGNASCRVPARHVFLAIAAHVDEFAADPAYRLDTMLCWHAIHVERGRKNVCRRHEAFGQQPAALWGWLESVLQEKQSTYIWSVAAARTFTLARGWHWIERDWLSPRLVVCNDHATIIRGNVRGLKFAWLSTKNWLRASVTELAKWTGITPIKEPDWDAGIDDWRAHAASQAEIVEASVVKLLNWHQRSDLGVFRFTASGQSLQLYRHRCATALTDDAMSPRMREAEAKDGRPYIYPVIHANKKVLRLERSAYYGPSGAVLRLGRVEGPVYQLDIQRCYPSLMGSLAYPARLVGTVRSCSVGRLRQLVREYATIGNVRVCGSDYEFPVRMGEHTIRCVGSAWTCLPGPEIQHLLRADCITGVWGLSLYERRRLFSSYRTAVERLRVVAQQEGDAVGEATAKVIANSLYGKFAQRGERWEPIYQRVSWPVWGEWTRSGTEPGRPITTRSVGGWLYELTRETEGEQSFPAISAYVTSYARLQMDRLVRCAGLGHVYYVCSDALHVDEEGYHALVDAGHVCLGVGGKLKVAGVYDWCRYYAVGRIETSEGRKCAGLSEQYWVNDDGELAHWQHVSAEELITSRLYNGEPLPGELVRAVVYSLRESAGGRIVGKDGWTYPRVLEMGGEA